MSATRFPPDRDPLAGLRARYGRRPGTKANGAGCWGDEQPEVDDDEPEDDTDRPTIRVQGGELHRMVEAAAEAIGAATRANPFGGFYRRGSSLVRIARLADDDELNATNVRRSRGALVIATAEPDALRVALTRACLWEKYDGRRNRWSPTDAPAAVAASLLATAEQWSAIPILTGIVEAPTLRRDGTVLDRPGYDERTGLLFDPGAVEFPPVPENPTREQAEAALAELRRLVADFPFLDGASEAVALSGFISPRVRRACRAVPLHAISAPKMASGKTLLATVAGYISNGRAPAMMSQAEDAADERKRTLAVLVEGHEINVIDNAERELKSDVLCTVLTEPRFSDRLLGSTKTVTVPSAATWFVTGNNLLLAGDLTARAISCALDPACERPEEREFDVDLHAEVPERRAELAVACLTIVRAYIAAGEPAQAVPNFARFEDWSRFVRKPLVWLGMEDPCAGRERVEGSDPVRAQLGALLEAWGENYPGEAATVADAVRLATRDRAPEECEADGERRARLREVLTDIAGKGGRIEARIVGRFIAKHERRVEGGFRFENAGVAHKAIQWKVSPVNADAAPRKSGVFGVFGVFSDHPTRGNAGDIHVKECGRNTPNTQNTPINPAAHKGDCPACGNPIAEGEPVTVDEHGKRQHADCWLGAER